MPSKSDDTTNLITILREIARGSETAIQAFYHDYYNTFIKYGHTITADRHAIEDGIQQLLIWMVEHPRRAHKLDRPDVYFYRSLRNNLIREQLKSQEHLQNQIRDTLSEMMVTQSAEKKWMQNEEEQEIIEKLQNEIKKLPDYLQQTLYLRYFSNLEYQDISSIMEIKPNVARIYIHRAIERLRAVIKAQDP